MLCWSKHSIAPRPDFASDWRVRASRYLWSLLKSTLSSKSTCVIPGACSGRCHWCSGFRSSASTGKNFGLPDFFAMGPEGYQGKSGAEPDLRLVGQELANLPWKPGSEPDFLSRDSRTRADAGLQEREPHCVAVESCT